MSDTYIGNTPAGADKWHADTPIGSIMAWPNANLPLGWLECNGQATTQYPELAALIGAVVPDLRGEFIRGFDNGKGTDIGRALGTSQTDENKEHSHFTVESVTMTTPTTSPNKSISRGRTAAVDQDYLLAAETTSADYAANTFRTNKEGAVESRPTNVALKYIIKAFNVLQTGETTSYLPFGKNYIINPLFNINQRAFAGGGVASAGTYTFDRWTINDTNTTVTVPDADDQVTIANGAGGTSGEGFQYRLPLETELQGEEITISWEGTAKMGYYLNNGLAHSTMQASPITITLDHVGQADRVEYLLFGNGTLRHPKVERGATVTPFELPDVATELAKCHRYYYRVGANDFGTAGYRSSVATYFTLDAGTVVFPVTMRAIPTVTALTALTLNGCTFNGYVSTRNASGLRVDTAGTGQYRAVIQDNSYDAEL